MLIANGSYINRSEELNAPKSHSLLVRHHSQQPAGPKSSDVLLHMNKRTSSLKSSTSSLSEQPKRLLSHSTSGSDLETTADSLAALCSCDPSTYFKLKLPLLRDEGTQCLFVFLYVVCFIS